MPPTYTTPSGELHLSEKAFNRLCERCDGIFESTAFAHKRARRARTDYLTDDVPFGTLKELLNSASKGACHFCCSLAARVLVSESAHLLTSREMKPDKQVHPSLQPVVSQGVFSGMEIEPAIDTLTAGGDKTLWLSWTIWPSEYMTAGEEAVDLRLNIVGEDGKPIPLTSWKQHQLLLPQEEDVYPCRVDGFPNSLYTGSEASLNQALQWVENCVSNHPSCNKAVHENLQRRHPARFLDVGCTGSCTVKLTETTGMDFQKQRYMTLSHCWGDSVPARLLVDNYDSRLKGFALDELPKTFQEAIRLTQRLDVQFLWIDCLCIIQDSLDDWEAESAKMRSVYQNTYLNLAAGASPHSSGGFFFPRHPLSFVPWSIRLATHSTLVQSYDINDTPILYTRGWVLQEQILPRRTLISGRQELYWECSMVRASECFPDSVPQDLSKSGVFTPPPMKLFQCERLLDAKRLEAWACLASDYSGRKLTKQSDKLVAISGLAEHLSNEWDGVTYLAGLWSYRLRENLLWKCLDVGQSKGRNDDIAPSWSWASLSAKCELPSPRTYQRMDILAEVLEAMVSPVTPTHLFGQIQKGGMVRIRGPLLRASCTARSTTLQPEWRYDLSEERDGMWTSLPDLKLSWDEQESHGSAIIYLAPLQVNFLGSLHFHLEGLFLRPALTSPARKGTFERLGVFEMVQEICYLPNQYLSGPFLDSTLYKALMFDSPGRHFHPLTGVSEEERMNLLKSDPYLNGPLNTTKLKHRYSPELEPEQYPNLAKFLDCLEIAAQYNRESDSPDENLGQDEGNGFYIYEIV
ncbi:HET-domain-containing protein [Neurospora hispaniola]|uniref:HET-domain-containing protein n=1 Tax=Neurospora hispaniola TaxID=588809 RepID=A0AAJ0MMY5_9PEZI|nr:HET-domain-containing protein [Neurospora hispaniola]